jgi:hypothetical protein
VRLACDRKRQRSSRERALQSKTLQPSGGARRHPFVRPRPGRAKGLECGRSWRSVVKAHPPTGAGERCKALLAPTRRLTARVTEPSFVESVMASESCQLGRRTICGCSCSTSIAEVGEEHLASCPLLPKGGPGSELARRGSAVFGEAELVRVLRNGCEGVPLYLSRVRGRFERQQCRGPNRPKASRVASVRRP